MQLLSVPKALNGGEGKSLLSPNAASVKGWVCNGGCGPIGLNVLSPPSSEQLGSSLSKLVGRSEGGQQPSTAGRGIRYPHLCRPFSHLMQDILCRGGIDSC